MRVWLKPDRLAQLGLTGDDVTNALREQNMQVAAGAIGSAPQTNAQAFEYSLFVNGRLSTVQEFENIIVRTKPSDGSIVYLKDVARVQLGSFSYSQTSFVNSNPCTILLVNQVPGGNAL
nr:hypothetical protein [Tanacetum cinerariifolium]